MSTPMAAHSLRFYLDCLRMERESPSYDYLRRLTRRHLERFPFENIGKIHYYANGARTGLGWLPDAETFLTHFAARGLGGNCYILNAHFGGLLRALGFRAELVRATGGNTHMALRVTIDDRAYYVDVGYGAPLFEPLVPEEEPRFSRYGETVEVTKLGDDRYVIDRRANGQSFVVKTIEWTAVELSDFDEAIAHSLRDEDENPFMRRIVATVFKRDAAYSVVNRKLFVKTDKGSEVHDFPSRAEWTDMMRATFGFDAGVVDEAVAFLRARGVVLFD
ncbi:arylamine N-acetyltransferase [Paenibacillus flagellatus]|uniref:Arylamine N-acetyltransferase n=1 Tax=Paenibacillus flagellatus TaxID=2211139 RepID=A0A2V5JYP9_9BACL|nr:arylamine N-acetyltransferase [Paenibacillus flagellatus]PYI50293.1 hypothetical protein DLM86_29940 [Paenibacillus flagellatus]